MINLMLADDHAIIRQGIKQLIEQKLLDLDPEQKNEYENIKEENQNYVLQIYQLREEMAELNNQLIEGENSLRNNPNKMEAHKLKDLINLLKRKKEELELQTNESGLSIDELKQRLMAKAKEQTIEKNNIDKKIPDTKKLIEANKKAIFEIEKEMKSQQKNDTTQKKNKKLVISSKLSNDLDDAKFRLLNEKLYKSSSKEALSYFQSNSEDFITYHKGFSLQAKKWPSNPNDLILKTLLLPKYKTMSIADVGCGEAILAQKLIPLGYNIKSFDLVALNDYVTVADMKNLPLEKSTIDLAVYCLSLMNKNFIPFIVEASRILKKEGKLLVAEISSRIVDISKFLNIFAQRNELHIKFHDEEEYSNRI